MPAAPWAPIAPVAPISSMAPISSIILSDLQFDDNLDCLNIRVYFQTGDIFPFYDAKISENATINDLLKAIHKKLNQPYDYGFKVYLRASPKSDTFFPLSRDTSILEEIEDFRYEEIKGWPRLYIKYSYNINTRGS